MAIAVERRTNVGGYAPTSKKMLKCKDNACFPRKMTPLLTLPFSHGCWWPVQAMKELVSDANFECSPQALSLQAMDTSHVALVQMTLRSDGFAHFRCDRNISMGKQ